MRMHIFEQYGIRVSEDGTVYSFRSGKNLKHCPCRNGYPRIYTYENQTRKGLYVHRLLALAFIPNPDGLPDINHIDGVKWNFALSNLEWVTHAQNMAHAKNTGLWHRSMAKGQLGPRNKIIMNLYNLKVSREILCQAFGMNRPALNQVIRENAKAS